jgi:hypothetical protein
MNRMISSTYRTHWNEIILKLIMFYTVVIAGTDVSADSISCGNTSGWRKDWSYRETKINNNNNNNKRQLYLEHHT